MSNNQPKNKITKGSNNNEQKESSNAPITEAIKTPTHLDLTKVSAAEVALLLEHLAKAQENTNINPELVTSKVSIQNVNKNLSKEGNVNKKTPMDLRPRPTKFNWQSIKNSTPPLKNKIERTKTKGQRGRPRKKIEDKDLETLFDPNNEFKEIKILDSDKDLINVEGGFAINRLEKTCNILEHFPNPDINLEWNTTVIELLEDILKGVSDDSPAIKQIYKCMIYELKKQKGVEVGQQEELNEQAKAIVQHLFSRLNSIVPLDKVILTHIGRKLNIVNKQCFQNTSNIEQSDKSPIITTYTPYYCRREFNLLRLPTLFLNDMKFNGEL